MSNSPFTLIQSWRLASAGLAGDAMVKGHLLVLSS